MFWALSGAAQRKIAQEGIIKRAPAERKTVANIWRIGCTGEHCIQNSFGVNNANYVLFYNAICKGD